MNRRIKVAFLGIMIGTNLFAFEKVGVTSFQFLKVIPDARSTAMGEAYTLLLMRRRIILESSGYDAKLCFINKYFPVDYIFDTKHFGTSIGLPSIGLHSIHLSGVDYGEIEVTDVNHLGFYQMLHIPRDR